jgi:hypothetical protein
MGFTKMFALTKRLALIKRRHRAWLRRRYQGDSPEDESTGGSMFDVLFE